jgi:flavin-dependent dehydrogenase
MCDHGTELIVIQASNRHDVILAGAGPAGSSTALRLARAGFRVALVEPKRFPRFKPCGEFLSPACLPLLRDLGVVDELERAGARDVRGMLVVHGETRAEGHYTDVGRSKTPADHGWAMRRELLDDTLLRAALATGGVELFEGWRADGLVRGTNGEVQGLVARASDGTRRELRASWTIGADGVRSRVAASLGVRKQIPWIQKIALTTRYAGVPWGDVAEAHVFERGFVGCAPLEDGAVSVGLVVDRAQFEREGLPRDQAFDAWLERLPAIGARLRRGRRIDPVRGTGPLAWRTSQQTFDGAALVGDACGYVDPITGEGIFFALRGGELLAESLIPSLHARRTDRSALDMYVKARRADIGSRNAFAMLLQRALRSPLALRAITSTIAARPGMADLLVSVTGDYVPLRELARPSVWWSAFSGAAVRMSAAPR